MVERMGIEPVIVCSHINKKCLFSALCGLLNIECPPLKIQSVPQNVPQMFLNCPQLDATSCNFVQPVRNTDKFEQ